MNELQLKICGIVQANFEKGEITNLKIDTDLTTVGMDSLTFISNIVAIEEAFEIEFPDEYLLMQKMNTIEKIANIVDMTLRTDR